jgi:hypothetical protein
MSDLRVIALAGALLLGGCFFLLYSAVAVRNGNAGIIGGVIGGAPVTFEFRWRAFWNVQVALTMGPGVFALLFGFMFLQIGSSAQDAATVLLTQACGVLFFAFAAMFLVTGPFVIADTARQLRKLEREAD